MDHVEVLRGLREKWLDLASEAYRDGDHGSHNSFKIAASDLDAAITALSAKPEGEAVAWRCKDYQEWLNGGFAWSFTTNAGDVTPAHEPLYLHPPRSHVVVVDEAMVERAARAICAEKGIDPDKVQIWEINGLDEEVALWTLFKDEARAALVAARGDRAG